MELNQDTHLALSLEDMVSNVEDLPGFLGDLKGEVGELGIVSDNAESHVIMDIGRRTGVHIDFYSHRPGKLQALRRAKKEDHPDETRYLFIGSGKRDEVIADKAGWEYLDLTEALDKYPRGD